MTQNTIKYEDLNAEIIMKEYQWMKQLEQWMTESKYLVEEYQLNTFGDPDFIHSEYARVNDRLHKMRDFYRSKLSNILREAQIRVSTKQDYLWIVYRGKIIHASDLQIKEYYAASQLSSDVYDQILEFEEYIIENDDFSSESKMKCEALYFEWKILDLPRDEILCKIIKAL